MPTVKATSEEERLRACFSMMRPSALLAMVISRPSSTQATPRAMTSRVWNRDHPKRSSRAGMRLRIVPSGGCSRSGRPGASMLIVATSPPFRATLTEIALPRNAPDQAPPPPTNRSAAERSDVRSGPGTTAAQQPADDAAPKDRCDRKMITAATMSNSMRTSCAAVHADTSAPSR